MQSDYRRLLAAVAHLPRTGRSPQKEGTLLRKSKKYKDSWVFLLSVDFMFQISELTWMIKIWNAHRGVFPFAQYAYHGINAATLRSTLSDNGKSFLSDGSFGPAVKNCSHRDFDFALTFEESILSISPSAIFILSASIRLCQLKNQRHRVGGRGFQLTKLVRKLVTI
jgi:hypothetical protein